MIGRKGKHTSRELVRRLRSENRFYERQMHVNRERLRKAYSRLRTERVQREIADGLVLKQTAALQAKNSEIADLRRQLQAASSDTVEMPVPTAVT
ncbi:hypothetical protein QA811_02220 [Streptomyces sp. B21-102]|uniref:hypothetical protein n=1 Tax=Streptomyces sp. B21-102 TaxID=3039416 RepID=UPI002FF2D39A